MQDGWRGTFKKIEKKDDNTNNFLTSKDEEVDELLGLKLGADDFVKKSGGFSMKSFNRKNQSTIKKKIDKVDETKNLIVHGKLKA